MSEGGLPFAQATRLRRMHGERHFVLDSSADAHHARLAVSGSTGNVYNITINAQSQQIECNCPDDQRNRSAAGGETTVCKHICFAVYRVFRSVLREGFFRNNPERRFNAEDITAYHRRVAHLQRVTLDSHACSNITSALYRERYKSLAANVPAQDEDDEKKDKREVEEDNREAFGVQLAVKCDAKDLVDCCGICCEEFAEAKPDESLVRCGQCKKYLHEECATVWFKNSKSTVCTYCRTWLPFTAYLEGKEQQEHERLQQQQRKRKRTESYPNVANFEPREE
jgi:hypothetical protein